MEDYAEDPNIYLKAEKQRQEQDPNSLYADYMRENKVINIIQQLNPDNLVEELEHRIRGEKRDSYTQEWKPINYNSKKEISSLLIENYVSFLSSLLTQNTSLSNFSSGEINNLMAMIVDHIRDDLSDNAEVYGFIKRNIIVITEPVKILKEVISSNGMILKEVVGVKLIRREIETNIETDFNEMNRIGMIICGTVFSVFKRAQNGMEARRIFGALKVSESLNQPTQKQGILEALKFWK